MDHQAEPPAPGGEVDEFAGIEPRRRHRSPLAALVVLALAGLIGARLAPDLRYALAPREPLELGDARRAATRELPEDAFVRLTAVPDRASALAGDVKGRDLPLLIWRALGTQGRLLVVEPGGRSLDEQLQPNLSGRLRRVGDLPYQRTLAEHFSRRVVVTHFLTPEAVRKARAPGAASQPSRVPDTAGDVAVLGDSARVVVDLVRPGAFRVAMPKERFPTEPDARREVESAGAAILETDDALDSYRYVVSVAPADEGRVLGTLREADARVRVELARDAVPARWGDLRAADDGLHVGARVLPWDAVHAVQVQEPAALGADTRVLLVGETPARLWWVPALYVVLILAAAFNLLALREALGRRTPRPPPPAPA